MTIFSNAPVIPGVTWDDSDYARLRLTLALYDDMIVAHRPALHGEPASSFVVDPQELAQRLTGLPVESGLLPRDCLFWQRRNGQERLAVYVPPQVWPVTVAGEGRWLVPLPGLVFVGHGTRYAAWAVVPPDDAPAGWLPDAGSTLYNCPTPNVSSNGVCAGNVPFPAASSGTIWAAVNLFFESDFNNHLSNNKSQRHRDSILKLWRELHDAGADSYPLDDLIKNRDHTAGYTLRHIMEAKK
jgi:hypothetical protein